MQNVTVQETNHQGLLNMVHNNTLTPFTFYTISDHVTKHVIPYTNTINSGIPEPLTVLALTPNSFHYQAYSQLFPEDIIYYDPFDTELSSESNNTTETRTGKITFRKDKNNNSTFYDFRNVRFIRYSTDCPIYDNNTTYLCGDICQIDNKIYKASNPVPITNDNPAINSKKNWFVWNNNTKITYPAWIKFGEQPCNTTNDVPGFINNINLIHNDYEYFYTFTDKNGYQRSDWFKNITINSHDNYNNIIFIESGITINSHDNYNNIIFIESGSNNSFNNVFNGNCYNMTIMSKCQNNTFGTCKNLILGEEFIDNKIGDLSCSVCSGKFTENIIHNRMAGNCFGHMNGNHFLGEAVYGVYQDGCHQHIFGVDFSFNLIKSNSYNTFGNFIWHSVFEDGFSNNTLCNFIQDKYFPQMEGVKIVSTQGAFETYAEIFNGTGYDYILIKNTDNQ